MPAGRQRNNLCSPGELKPGDLILCGRDLYMVIAILDLHLMFLSLTRAGEAAGHFSSIPKFEVTYNVISRVTK